MSLIYVFLNLKGNFILTSTCEKPREREIRSKFQNKLKTVSSFQSKFKTLIPQTMEALYKKLYTKYTTLKVLSLSYSLSLFFVFNYSLTYLFSQTNKLSELEDVNKEQELKFLKFVSGIILHSSFYTLLLCSFSLFNLI